jgi:DNA modification methylase
MRWPSSSAAPTAATGEDYLSFLKDKCQLTQHFGFDVALDAINPLLKPHQAVCTQWAIRGGRRALFEDFGLGKSVQQLEILRLILKELGSGRALIVAPLGVRQEFIRDAQFLATGYRKDVTEAQRVELRAWQEQQAQPSLIPRFIRTSEEVDGDGLYITNYESVREGLIDPDLFAAVSLDEASILRGFGGTKTFREFMRRFDGIRFKFVATATPDPNEYIELLAYAAFLDVMDVGQAKTRFFKRDPQKADHLTIHPHKQQEFWFWLNTWAVFLGRPSDLGFSDEGYDLPPLDVRWHEIPTDHRGAGEEKDGQARLLRNTALGVVDAAREKRDSLVARIAKLMEIRAEDPTAHRMIWHDLEAEREALEAAIPDLVTIFGKKDLDEREVALLDFSDGKIAEFAAKPVMAGSGGNFQRHCSWAIFLGIGFKFNDFIQAIHRLQRFLQPHIVRVDIIYTEAEREVRANLEAKWRRHEEQSRVMTEIIRQYRLNESLMTETLTRSLGVDRVEAKGETYTLVNNDSVLELPNIASDSVDLIVTSIPFSTQYEYTPSYHDFGHTDDNEHFWRQMDYLAPELYRVLKPGRDAIIHVKDRIVPGGINGYGFQTVAPFSDEASAHYQKHGFALLGRKTIVTDVVRENSQTNRLGWSEQCKDGTRMGWGMPEYLLLFRKPPTDSSNGYADEPVAKTKRAWDRKAKAWTNEDGYSRARWQVDAHGFARSNGDRLLQPEELLGLTAQQVYRMFKKYSLENVYDVEQHVRIAEALEEANSLPKKFMLLPPASWHPDVWADVVRMRTLNTMQAVKGEQQHLCPLPIDIVKRVITQHSMPGELVLDPFGGLMTVPYVALELGRRAYAIELSPFYFHDGCYYVKAMEQKMSMPTLFDLVAAEKEVDEFEDVAVGGAE